MSLQERDLLALLAQELAVGKSTTRPPVGRTEGPPEIRVFLCYARPDQERVIEIYEKLESDGIRPWLDVKSLVAGENWQHAIRNAIQQADFFLVCLSSNSVNKRGFLQREIRIALDKLQGMLAEDIYLIPMLLEECRVPAPLDTFQWLDMSVAEGYAHLLHAIREGMKRRFGQV